MPGLLGKLGGVSDVLEITTRLLLRNPKVLRQSTIALISPPNLAIAPNEFSSSLEMFSPLIAITVPPILQKGNVSSANTRSSATALATTKS